MTILDGGICYGRAANGRKVYFRPNCIGSDSLSRAIVQLIMSNL